MAQPPHGHPARSVRTVTLPSHDHDVTRHDDATSCSRNAQSFPRLKQKFASTGMSSGAADRDTRVPSRIYRTPGWPAHRQAASGVSCGTTGRNAVTRPWRKRARRLILVAPRDPWREMDAERDRKLPTGPDIQLVLVGAALRSRSQTAYTTRPGAMTLPVVPLHRE